MKGLAIGSVLALLASSGVGALAGAIEDSTFAAFETLCVHQVDQPHKIPELVSALRGRELAPPQTAAFVEQYGGKAWTASDGRATFIVALRNDGVCIVYNPDARSNEVRDLLVSQLSARLLTSKKTGSDTNYFYKSIFVSRTGGPDREVMTIATSSDLASQSGVRLATVPKR